MRRCAWIALLLLLATAAYGAKTVPHGSGSDINSAPHPKRIISLAPHVTELLYAVGAGASLVAVDASSDYPIAARQLPRIGDHARVNFERVLTLEPDLIVGWQSGNRISDIYRLRRMGFRVLLTDAQQLTDVPRLLRELGKVTGNAEKGERAARAFETRLSQLRTKYSATQPRRVFYQVWDQPLMTIGGRHWINDAIELCGGRNIFADLHTAAPLVSLESVVLRSPEIIISGSDAPDRRNIWQRFPGVPAVARVALVRIHADNLHRPTPRLLGGVESLCQIIRAS